MRKIIYIIIVFFAIITLHSQEAQVVTLLNFSSLSGYSYLTSPTLTFDGKHLAFVAVSEDGKYHLYTSDLQADSLWSEPEEVVAVTQDLPSGTVIKSVAFNYDATVLYFDVYVNGTSDIFYSKKENGKWTSRIPLPSTINSPAKEGEPSISSDDNILYFVRFDNPKDKESGTIYVSHRKPGGQWTEATPLPPPINTGKERSPRILADNKTLLFSSKRDGKRFKIYRTQNIYGNFWFVPKQVNQFDKYDNLYPSVDFNAERIYFASVINGKKSKIVYSKFPSEFKPDKTYILKGTITDSSGTPLLATIKLLNPISLEPQGIYYTDPKTGHYQIFIPKNQKLIVFYTAPGYSSVFIPYDNNKKRTIIDERNIKLFDKIRLKLNVFDKDIFEPLDVDIKASDAKTGNQIPISQKKLDEGKYLITLPIGSNYNIHLSGNFVKDYDMNIDLSGIVIFDRFERNAEITSEKVLYKMKVVDKETGKGIKCKVTLVDKKTSKKIVTYVTTDENGNINFYTRKGGEYDITINPQGYTFYTSTLNVKEVQPKKTEVIELQPLKQDTKIELQNITFATNSADLNVESYKELNKVIQLLNNNPQIKVEISAHTDDVGSEQYNMKLSELRAKAVVDYLIMHDIPRDRLIAKGYGESKPLVPNTSDENRALNRRVELKIIEVNN